MIFLRMSLFFLLLFSCNTGSSSSKKSPDTTQNATDSSLELELDAFFVSRRQLFEPIRTDNGNYRVVLQKGKNYTLSQLSSEGSWSFSIEGLGFNDRVLTVPDDAEGAYTLIARQQDSRYKQRDVSIEIVFAEKSVFDDEIELLDSHSKNLEGNLEKLTENVELSQLNVKLGDEVLSSAEFAWEYQLEQQGRSKIDEAQESFSIDLDKLDARLSYTLTITARARSGVAGTLVKRYTLSKAAKDFSYPFFELDNNQVLQSITPILSTQPATGQNYSYTPEVPGLSINKDTGVLSFNTLANFAVAGGRAITVNVGEQEASVVPLKIQAADKAALQSLITLFINDSNIGVTGNYNAIDTSQVKDMSELFKDKSTFNGDISNWNTAAVIDMSNMFSGATIFNQNIRTDGNKWNTAKVTNMSGMFNGAAAFNSDISNWNTSEVTNMSEMFEYAAAFDQPLGNWVTSKVTNMKGMFNVAAAFNQPLKDWDTSKVTDMSYMFSDTEFFDQPLDNWDTSKVTNMQGMFWGAIVFDHNIKSWDVQAIENGGLSDMFYLATAFNKANSNEDPKKTNPRTYFTILQ